MTDPLKLRIILGENNSEKLFLPFGIPESVDDLKLEIQRQCAVAEDFRLQYKDADFGEFFNLISTADLQNLGTVKVIKNAQEGPSVVTLSSAGSTLFVGSSSFSSTDTEILSSPESTSSTSTMRSQAWPASFPIPQFSYEVELQLVKANQEYTKNGTFLNPSPKLKSSILESLASEIIKYKAYPNSAEFDDVAEALIKKHACLKEQGSVTGFYGWKISLKYKMANYRTSLTNITSELSINSLKRRRGDTHRSPNQVKKPRRAEVNYLPDYPAGEDKESMEKERLELLSEVNKRDNHQIIKMKMDKTFAHRRHEVVVDMPSVEEFKSRWPALFSEREICAEFTRITTIALLSKFMSELDHHSPKLSRVCRKKGGAAGRKIAEIMAVIEENDTIATRRVCNLKSLAVYFNEDPEKLIKEYLDVNFDNAQRQMDGTAIGIYVIKHEGADASDPPEDVGIIVEDVAVLQDIGDAATATALLLAVIYNLNLSYPPELKYTFEFLQKVLMGIDTNRLSNKVQVLKNKLHE
ncbi:uncharacterized protein LOC133949105 [Platichthys flesus]|uniref:uncharacterized protein LOC133949105 n=1 Tax=Platichthys flesus TaxID=8260 RepID=UPI002DB7D890|nr:uncharacterized protein LOC133949105 [Platichthys flesus]XP_062239271.1 uncharacterized protein LOC133949105 [Platichthys flesus]XP_062239272.1 uncharacterized protein LOC133949105 [Platichthys flesus]